jgi:DNA-binding CsgD family transcriptional regulator
MIKSTAFKHGSNTYHYRQHQAKCEKFLSGSFASLGSHLLRLHNDCPNEPFAEDPRASKQKFSHNINLVSRKGHERSFHCSKGLEENSTRFKTPHSQVLCWMLENDRTTVAVEIPVWVPTKLIDLPISPSADGGFLSGHIDALAVENDTLWIWDFKPRANREEWAVGQITLYAMMLSIQLKLPLSSMKCGYFDTEDCYTFAPQANHLLTNHATVATGGDASPPRPKAERSGERREASKIPDLRKQGIKQPHVALTQTEFYTWHLFTNEKLKASEIAAHRQISENTIYEHLSHSIELGVLKWDMVITPEIRKRVLEAEKAVGKAPDGFLKRIHLALNSEVSYGQIRCALASK